MSFLKLPLFSARRTSGETVSVGAESSRGVQTHGKSSPANQFEIDRAKGTDLVSRDDGNYDLGERISSDERDWSERELDQTFGDPFSRVRPLVSRIDNGDPYYQREAAAMDEIGWSPAEMDEVFLFRD